MLHAARKAIADAVRGEPVRYGSFLPESEKTQENETPVLHMTTADPPPPGSIVTVRLVRGGAPS
jgi:hypothetical protein